MTSLLRMPDDEFAQLSGGREFRVWTAVAMATSATVLALLGMMSRSAEGHQAPLPGMASTGGQIAWAVGLGAMMMLAAWLVHNVVMKRLQGAIVISLVLHLLFCVSIQWLGVDLPMVNAVQADEQENAPLEELTLPDYGGMEAIDAPEAEWEQAAEVELTEDERQELERQQAQAEVNMQQEAVEVERQLQVAQAGGLERQQVEAELNAEAAANLQRQQLDQELNSPQAVAEPEVQTQDAAQANLDAREMQRDQAQPQLSEREMTDVELEELRVEAARLEAQRNDSRPAISQNSAEQLDRRRPTDVRAAEPSVAEAVEVETAEARQANAEAQELQTNRQSQTALPNRTPSSESLPSSASETRVTSVNPERVAVSNRNMVSEAPSSGGSATLNRSETNSAGQVAAADASATGVQVNAAAGVESPTLNASTQASTATRGSTATVPTGAASRGGSPTASSSTSGVRALGSGAVGGRSNSRNQARLGQAVNTGSRANTRQGTSSSQQLQAAGSRAGDVVVSSAGRSRANGRQVLASGPGSTSVRRQGSGLPAANRTGRTTSSAPGSSSGRQVASIRSGGRSGLRGRATNPDATLGANAGFSGQGDQRAPSTGTRRTLAASLPDGAAQAEQAGNLVVAGPQASAFSGSGGGGALSGPRGTSVRRQSAGLPGVSRSAGVGRSRPSLPGRISAGLPGRSAAAGSRRPSLASSSEIAGLVKRSVSGPGAAIQEAVSPGFSMRRPDVRRDAVRKLGGSDASEAAVERGLAWLAAHQFPDGHWGVHEFNCQDHNCNGHGSFKSDSAATGLALLAFLGAGYTHESGKYQEVVGKGLNWLTSKQKADGDLFVDESEFVWFYSHGMASIALCEAYGMTKDSRLKRPAQESLNFIVDSQHPQFGGWRYEPRFESDTSVSGWQLMALKSGEMAGLAVPKTAYQRVAYWLDQVEAEDNPGRFKYHPSKPASLAMTAEGLLMRQYLGSKRTDADLIAGAGYLKQRLPRDQERDAYYWYYATQVMFHMQGDHWTEWNGRLRDLLVDSQEKGGNVRGSWGPKQPTQAKWGSAGGRHYLTCLNLLMLEVYYRHLPLYIELDK